jgi:8-hydroxy-5-deazaflavin:NADPH oxidoreductase
MAWPDHGAEEDYGPGGVGISLAVDNDRTGAGFMSIGIIGAGGIGMAFATQAARAGYDVILSNSRGPESLVETARKLGQRVRAGTRQEAAQSDIVVVAVQWQQLRAALADLPAWNGRIVIDAMNPILMPEFRVADLDGKSSSEIVASLLPGARVVKTANTLTPELLASDPSQAGGRRVLFVSGDDADAKTEVAGVLEKAGFATVDLGGLAVGGRLQQFPGGSLPGLNLIRLG